ncbi:oxygenase MpaB family protein [Robbsia sp. Bb-Pol-6]|uniref:Oxygenase MpaB family protein n=1 Tax=Robbsia betulipollinis TaxID=2981849 RepID=A0ABT3ZLD8_9BURK|nr:oxygenase MpaB family protein [Robbsia betulipollinis]MCY0387356.1 oxygenase MpaB family protein [Robbsia betulipollinis]
MSARPPSLRHPLDFLRARIASGVNRVTTDSKRRIDYGTPLGDPGLFGPDAVCWQVHADFTSMLVGGVAALLLQMLHPLALAGVWDHSTFRDDIHGRLGRTATFIAATTYGSRADALSLIERVRKIHEHVRGVAPDGTPYAANDPALLTWVHVAEMSSFLRAHLVYVNPDLSPQAQDRYYAETALVAEMLGARGVPRNRAEIADYLLEQRAVLVCDARTRAVVDVLMHAPAPNLATWPAARLLLHAGPDLLPDWAQAMFGLDRHAALRRLVVRAGVNGVAPVMRWALTNGVSKRARARVGAAGIETG